MIKSHPHEQLLVQYATGELNPAMLVMIGTHVDMCPQCQQHVADIEEQVALKVLGERIPDVALPNTIVDSMLESIMNSPMPIQTRSEATRDYISLEGKRFSLPATLARNEHRIGQWHHMVSKLWRAPIDIGSGEMLNLIYMADGAQVPEHTHKGREATLVINGVFNDEFNEYRDGDFILLDEHHKHTPQTQGEDCLTLATLDAPMHFTSGISRLLNPFSSLFFR